LKVLQKVSKNKNTVLNYDEAPFPGPHREYCIYSSFKWRKK